jgi:hypothetical protein
MSMETESEAKRHDNAQQEPEGDDELKKSHHALEHDPEKWVPVFRKDHAPPIEHDPEKWVPVFGKDHAPPIEHDPEKACPGPDPGWVPVFGKRSCSNNSGDAYDDISRAAWALLIEVALEGRISPAAADLRAVLEGAPPPTAIALDLDPGRLREDLQRAMLCEIKQLPKPWERMVECEQQRLIDRLDKFARAATIGAVNVAAACDFPYLVVSLGKFQLEGEKGIKIAVSTPETGDSAAALIDHGHRTAILVLCDSQDFMQARAAIEADVVGDLAMPRRPAPAAEQPLAGERPRADEHARAEVGRRNGESSDAGALNRDELAPEDVA